MKRGSLAALLVPALLAGGPARAENPGVTAAPILQVPLGARALGMGGAFTAVATDATALQYNPAGLARLTAHEIAATYVNAAGETTLQHFAYAGPTPFSGISGNGYTSAAASLLMSQAGTIQVNTLNADGSLGASRTLSAETDLIASAGYAERVGMTPIDSGGDSYNVDHFLGVSGKYVRSTLVESYHASAFAADVGYLVRNPETGMSLGLAVLNLGGRLRYVDAADPLPATLKGGIAWQGAASGEHSVIAAADGDYVLDEKLWHVDAGVEYFWMKSYGLRLGYQFNRPQEGGLTVGVGYRWKGRILFDYAYDLGDALGSAQRVTLTYRFGGVPPSVRGRQRRPFIESAPEREAPAPEVDQVPALLESAPQPEPQARPRPRAPEPASVPGWIY